MPRTTVLVGFAEALAAPEAVWSLLDYGFGVVAFARRGRRSALRHSRHVLCHEICPPESDLRASLAEIQSLCDSVGAGEEDANWILFPLDDKAVWLCSKMQIGRSWRLAGPQGAAAELALNKCAQAQAARNAGFDVPNTGFARTVDEVFSVSEVMAFPIILKAADSVPMFEGRFYPCRKWICANSEELERAVKEWNEHVPLLIQPFIVGTGEGIFGLATEDGARAWSGHRRLRMMNPQGSGSSACISQPVPNGLRSKAEELIRQTSWRGLFMIELLRDQAGHLWFVELNGRPWGSLALARRQGFEYPAWNVACAIDPHADAGTEARSERPVVCRNLGREIMHLLFVLRGPKSKALVEWPGFWKTVADVIPIRRMDRFYNWRGDDRKVFLADCYYTIHDNLFKSRD